MSNIVPLNAIGLPRLSPQTFNLRNDIRELAREVHPGLLKVGNIGRHECGK